MKKILTILTIVLFVSSCYDDNEEDLYGLDCNTKNLTYSNDIKKIITNSCATTGCHVAGTGLADYSTYAILKIDIDNKSVYNKVIQTKTMPKGSTLSDCDFKMIDEWLKQGALE